MPEEKEIKIKINKEDLAKIKNKLLKEGYNKDKEIKQEDIYFDFKDRKLLDTDHIIRARLEDNKPVSFDFKTIFYLKNKNKWYIDEICLNLPITDQLQFLQIFNRIGILVNKEETPKNYEDLIPFLLEQNMYVAFRILKKRETFFKEDLKIMLDAVENLGYFLEIECGKGEPLKILKKLGLNEDKRVILGYTSLYMEKYFNRDSIKIKEKYYDKPDWNVFEKEKPFFTKLKGERI